MTKLSFLTAAEAKITQQDLPPNYYLSKHARINQKYDNYGGDRPGNKNKRSSLR